jgi:predicted dehydrogenase
MSVPHTSPNTGAPRIALIGCGAIAESYYLPALAKYPRLMENLLLVDRNEARVQQLGQKLNVKERLTDYRSALDRQVDGVIVATPDHLHYPISAHFLSSGVHVLCDKPLAQTAPEAEELVRLALSNNAALAVNYTRRLFASSREVKRLLDDAAIGAPVSFRHSEGFDFNWPTVSGYCFDWRTTRKGVLVTQGTHVVDLICWWLGGKPEPLEFLHDSFGGPEALAHVKFKYYGCTGEITLSFLNKLPDNYLIQGEYGSIVGSTYDPECLVLTGKSGKSSRVKLSPGEVDYFGFGNRIVANFLRVVEKQEAPLVSGQDVLDSIRFIDECYSNASRFAMPWYEGLETVDGE